MLLTLYQDNVERTEFTINAHSIASIAPVDNDGDIHTGKTIVLLHSGKEYVITDCYYNTRERWKRELGLAFDARFRHEHTK